MTDELTDGELAQPWCSQEELSYLIRVIALDQVMLPKEIQALLGFLIKQNYASLYVVLLLIALLDPCLQIYQKVLVLLFQPPLVIVHQTPASTTTRGLMYQIKQVVILVEPHVHHLRIDEGGVPSTFVRSHPCQGRILVTCEKGRPAVTHGRCEGYLLVLEVLEELPVKADRTIIA